MEPEGKKYWTFFYSHHCHDTANDYQHRNQTQECAQIYHLLLEELVGLCTNCQLYFKKKFLLLINISNHVLGFKSQSAYHFQQERATASIELLEATVEVTSLSTPQLKKIYRTAHSSKKRQDSSRIRVGYRKLLLTFALGAKCAVSLSPKFATTLFLPGLQHLVYPIHGPGFIDLKVLDKQEIDRHPASNTKAGFNIQNRHTMAQDGASESPGPRAPSPSACYRIKNSGN